MEITDRVHEHGRACWWDHLQCRRVRAPVAAAPAPPPVRESAARVGAEPVPAGR